MTPVSFRQIASSMDRLYPPNSLRELMKRFRYFPDKGPGYLPPSISFRTTAFRIAKDSNPKIELLHYNTWLLEARIDLALSVKSTLAIPQALTCLGLSLVDVLTRALEHVGTDNVCDVLFPPIVSVCGVSINPLNDACRAIGSVGDLATFLLEHFDISFIFDALSIPAEVVLDIALKMFGLDDIGPVMNAKPEMDSRANEIGEEVFAYNWVSLVEVWDKKRRQQILSHGPTGMPVFTGPAAPGPSDWQQLGSGLLVFSPNFPLQDGGSHTYQTAGVQRNFSGGCNFGPLVDSDLWAKKGIQLTRLADKIRRGVWEDRSLLYTFV
jgi:hypothetical protein